MKVKDLIEILQGQNPDDLVVLSEDPEGNGFGVLSQIDKMRFSDGEVGLREVTDEQREEGYTDEDVSDGTDCLVLWP